VCILSSPNTAYTRSSTLTKRSNVFESKSGCTSIRRPLGSTTASPQLDSCCVGDFLAANSTGTNRLADKSPSTLSLPALLLQMTVKRAEAQPPTPTKLGASHAAAHKLRH
jgi:hypothetical protein